jgi:RHS repeat-associated protein
VIASGTYTYDSLDRRIGVDETSGGTTTKTWIVYNGNSNTPYAEFNGSGTLLERYLAGPSYVPGVTGMVARTNASGVTDWYLTGKLGSVRDIVNTSGTVIDHISYGAFGSIRAETNPSSGSQFKFDGMQYDTITGLYNDWHRGYNPNNGRFISQDPTGFKSNISNLYIYASNNITNNADYNGYAPPDISSSGDHQTSNNTNTNTNNNTNNNYNYNTYAMPSTLGVYIGFGSPPQAYDPTKGHEINLNTGIDNNGGVITKIPKRGNKNGALGSIQSTIQTQILINQLNQQYIQHLRDYLLLLQEIDQLQQQILRAQEKIIQNQEKILKNKQIINQNQQQINNND